MKKILILFLALLPFFVTSCKKKIVAEFEYDIYYDYDLTYAECNVHFVDASNADYFDWTLYRNGAYYKSSSDMYPVFSINVSGNYTLELKAYNSKYSTTVRKDFTITLSGDGGGGGSQTAPTASFNITSSNGNYSPTTIYCNNTSSNATHYQWTLTKPDYTTTTSSNTNPSFSCNQTGTYTIKLVAYNSNNVSSTISKSFTLTTPSVRITYLKLTEIPMLDDDNSSWDTGMLGGADPDIYFKILTSSNSVLYTSATKEDVAASDLPVTWNSINLDLDYGSNYYVRFYDEDGSLDPDDMISGCILNTSYMAAGNSSYTWTGSSNGTEFIVGLSWSNSKGGELEVTTVTENEIASQNDVKVKSAE